MKKPGGNGTCLQSQHSGGRSRRISVSSRPAWSAEQPLGQPVLRNPVLKSHTHAKELHEETKHYIYSMNKSQIIKREHSPAADPASLFIWKHQVYSVNYSREGT